jgi:hypothetical protein
MVGVFDVDELKIHRFPTLRIQLREAKDERRGSYAIGSAYIRLHR